MVPVLLLYFLRSNKNIVGVLILRLSSIMSVITRVICYLIKNVYGENSRTNLEITTRICSVIKRVTRKPMSELRF